MLAARNQNAKAIMAKPATTLRSAKNLIPRLVLVSILVSTDWTLLFL